jgi:hypothetical protein
MADGPGKYDTWTTLVRNGVHAEGVLLMVVNGIYGSGFSCQGSVEVNTNLPTILRNVADQIEADNKKETNHGN